MIDVLREFVLAFNIFVIVYMAGAVREPAPADLPRLARDLRVREAEVPA